MVEFRRDVEGRALLMEVNPRIGGSVGLAIAAGVNFPQLMYDWKLGYQLAETSTYHIGQRLRWLAGDIWNIKSVFENQGLPDVPSRGSALASFLLDFVRGGNKLDVIELDDMGPALSEMDKTVLRHTLRRLRGLVWRQSDSALHARK